jgi:hypothetical protein
VKNLRKSRSKNLSVGQLEESDLLDKIVNGVETWMVKYDPERRYNKSCDILH